ncbi:MAG: response regulator transcription factor [Candidatus Obscuribacterales bacterium]|nr:response regulator transcription factor [Candidatus Obscuribacterales bacterium]
MAKLLIVEDDEALRRLVADWLKRQNMEVESVSTGQDALAYLNASEYDLVILDIGLPDIEGFSVLEKVRQRSSVPVLILTGKKTVEDKERGFDVGADDYLTKPFDMRELTSRVRALLRRPRQITPELLSRRDLLLDSKQHQVRKDNSDLKISPKEFMLLEFFMRNPDQVFSAEALLERVWRSESEATEEAIVACIRRLRKRLDENNNEAYIGTVYGVGYIFKSN